MCHIHGIKRCKLDTSPSFCPSFLPPTIYSSPLSLPASPLLILKGFGEGGGWRNLTPLTSSSYFSCGQSLCQPNVHTSFSSSRSHPCNKICQHKMQAKLLEKTFRFCRSLIVSSGRSLKIWLANLCYDDTYYWDCNSPVKLSVRLSVGWLNGLSVEMS